MNNYILYDKIVITVREKDNKKQQNTAKRQKKKEKKEIKRVIYYGEQSKLRKRYP